MTTHLYDAALTWTGPTRDYRSYPRHHEVTASGSTLKLSADKAFREDPTKPDPGALLVAAASSCQLLGFLAVAAPAKCYIANSLSTQIVLEPTIEVI